MKPSPIPGLHLWPLVAAIMALATLCAIVLN